MAQKSPATYSVPEPEKRNGRKRSNHFRNRILWRIPGRHGTMAKDIKVEMKSYVYFTTVLKMKNDRHEKSE